MAEERIVITIREDGSRIVVRNINNIGTAAHGANNQVHGLSQALNLLAATLAVDKLRKWVDTWTSAKGKVNIFTKSVEETNMVLDRLVSVAQDTRQPLDATVNSFHQLTLASSALGASQNDILAVTASVNKVFAIQGTTAMTARGGIIQFGQAMTEGIVRAQEYNSMINAMPLLLKVVAQNIDGAAGSVAKLRQMMLKGKLFSKDFFDALKKGGPTIQALFDRSGRTIGQAFTILDTAMTQFVGKMDTAIGFSQTFFKLAEWGAQNIEHLAKGLIALTAPLVIRGLWAVVAALRAMGAAALLNPWTAIAAAVIAAGTALALYKDQIILVEKEQISLGDYAKATWDVVAQGARDAAQWIGDTLPAAIEKAAGNITGFQVNWQDITTFLRNTLNMWIGWFSALPKLFLTVWETVPAALYNIFATAFNSIKGQVADFMNGMIDAINPILAKANLGEVARISFQQSEVKIVDSWGGMADKMKGIVQESMNVDYVGAAIKGFDELTAKAKVYADKRKEDAKNQAETERQIAKLMGESQQADDFSMSGKGKKKKSPKGEFDNPRTLENYLRRLLNQIQPLSGATLEYERAQRILNAAKEKGLITGEQEVKYLELVKNHYRDIVDPIGAVTREMERELNYLNMSADARTVATRAYQIEEDLRKQGIITTAAESAEIKKQLELLQEQQKLSQARDTVYQNTQGAIENIVNMQKALNEAVAAGSITQEYYTAQMAKSNVEFAAMQNMLGNGTFLTVFSEGVGAALEGFTTLASGTAKIIGDVMTTAIDGISNSIAGAIVKGEDLRTTLTNVATTIATELISSLIKLGIQYLLNATLGNAAAAASTAASIGMAAATAAAWAPAAAAASLASFGANSVPAIAGMASAYAASSVMSAVPGFKTGGDMMVGGNGGADSQLVAFMATPNEKVSIRKPGQKGYDDSDSKSDTPTVVNYNSFNLPGITNAKEAKQSTAAINRGLGTAMNASTRYS